MVRIGGDFGGKDPSILHSDWTIMKNHAKIFADGHLRGDGGKIILWGTDAIGFYGCASLRGGAESGDGGFFEVSTRKDLSMGGMGMIAAFHGKPGKLFVDPADVTISNAPILDISNPNPVQPASGAEIANFPINTTGPQMGLLAYLAIGSVEIDTSN